MEKKKRQAIAQLWESNQAPAPPRDFLRTLSISNTLPLQYWQRGYLFWGIFDDTLYKLTQSRFPAKVVPLKRRPVFCIRVLNLKIGAEVCPCTTRKQGGESHYIGEGCRLYHTGYTVQKDSYIIEKIRCKIPAYTAGRLRFLGEVPENCIKTSGARNDGK